MKTGVKDCGVVAVISSNVLVLGKLDALEKKLTLMCFFETIFFLAIHQLFIIIQARFWIVVGRGNSITLSPTG